MSAGLRALAAKAVPGGWGAFGQPGGDPWLVINRGGGLSIMVTGLDVPDPEPTARFIAACDPQTILALLDERDAAIRRTESLLDIFDRATTSNNDSTPLYDYLGDDARATVDAARTIVAPPGLPGEREALARELLGVEPVDNGDGTETVTWPPKT